MTNREKLSKMALFDMLMYLDVCADCVGYNLDRCRKYNGKCCECRAAWLNEQAKGSDKHENA